jgi:hypothetical protein
MHLNEGFTRVLVERTEGRGMANGGATWDIPTQIIPPHLRRIGSRFIVLTEALWPEPGDAADELRDAISYRVEELEET